MNARWLHWLDVRRVIEGARIDRHPLRVPPVREGYRGINIVHDPAENLEATRVLPEPGGLPGAEPLRDGLYIRNVGTGEMRRVGSLPPLTPFPCPAIVSLYPEEPLSEAKPATCDEHGVPLVTERGFHEMRISLDRHLPKDAIVVIGPDHQSVLVRWLDRDEGTSR